MAYRNFGFAPAEQIVDFVSDARDEVAEAISVLSRNEGSRFSQTAPVDPYGRAAVGKGLVKPSSNTGLKIGTVVLTLMALWGAWRLYKGQKLLPF